MGAAVALRLGAGFVPCRKPGKLPRTVLRESYALEYGTDVLEIHADALTSDDVVLIVDDLVATGGTTTAMVRLVRASGARLAGLGFVMELAFLNPRRRDRRRGVLAGRRRVAASDGRASWTLP